MTTKPPGSPVPSLPSSKDEPVPNITSHADEPFPTRSVNPDEPPYRTSRDGVDAARLAATSRRLAGRMARPSATSPGERS